MNDAEVPLAAHRPRALLAPEWARVVEITEEAQDVATFWMEFDDADIATEYTFRPGQFNMLYVPGYGEAAISLSSDPARQGRIGHTIRFVGNVTGAIRRMVPGDRIGVRGPFGNAWPVDACRREEIVFVAGGIGLAPLRPALYQVLEHREAYDRVYLLYGARSPADLLYSQEYENWRQQGVEVLVTVDQADESWQGLVGVVPMLFYRLRLQSEVCAVLSCGPDIMMRFVVYESLARRVPEERIFLSLERNMKCGQGFCGHCQMGPNFVCTDGPVFNYGEIEPYFGVEDF